MSQSPPLVLRLLPWVAPLALAPAFAGALAEAASWPIVHDLPLMLYAGFLMDEQGLVPYRDFFEMNPPGTLYFNRVAYAVIGSDPAAFRAVHLTWLAAILAGIVVFLRRWGLPAGLAGAMCFAVAYVGTGRDSAFQRELLLTLPIVWSLVLAFPARRAPGMRPLCQRAFVIGSLLGLAAAVKPPAAIGWPVVLLGLVLAGVDGTGWRRIAGRPALVLAAWSGLGFALPLAVLAAALWVQGALAPFLDMATHYWPLYRQVAGDGRVLSDGMAAFAAAQTLERIREYPYLAAAVVGAGASFSARVSGDRTRSAAVVVILLSVCAWTFYVFYGGKTWYYHAHPLYLMLSLLAGLGVVWLAPDGPIAPVGARAFAAVGVLALLLLPAPRQSKPLDLLSVEAVASHLERNLAPGDRVLPVDVASGALHAMLRAKAPLAGSFLYSFHFLHHADTPYIQGLRARQLEEIRRLRPRYVVRAVGGWQIQAGDGPARFADLDRLLARDYRLVPLRVRGRLDLLERIGPSGPDEAASAADR